MYTASPVVGPSRQPAPNTECRTYIPAAAAGVRCTFGPRAATCG